MSFKNIQGILDADVGDPIAKLVLLTINHYANQETMIAYPSISTIAKKSGLSERTVIRKLEHLVNKKFLIRKRQGKNQVNIYRVRKCQPVTMEVTECHSEGDTVTHEPTNNILSNREKGNAVTIKPQQKTSSLKKSNNYNSKRDRAKSSFFFGINSKLRGST